MMSSPHALARRPSEGRPSLARRANASGLQSTRAMPESRVCLVGAGPGHAGLIPVRAVECLKLADLVLYDPLVPPLLLDYAPASAERVCVTELAAHHVERQAPVVDLMLDAARAGKRVVRLKGGDPLIFG